MESLISPDVRGNLAELVKLAVADKQAELELKVLAKKLHVKDEIHRIVSAIQTIALEGQTDEHRAIFSYPDNLRVVVTSPEAIFKVCTTNSFRDVPVVVERKTPYFEGSKDKKDTIEVPDLNLRATLRKEQEVRRDFGGSPSDESNHVRILHRKSWKTRDGLLRIDMSMVKSKTEKKRSQTLKEILRYQPSYELEIEVIKKDASPDTIVTALLNTAVTLVAAYQQSSFVLTNTDIQRYKLELETNKIPFINPVTMSKKHMVKTRYKNILSGYSVTIKADGERCMLVVMRDRRVVRWTRKGTYAWTGLTARDDSHHGDILDGEFVEDKNLFLIFDVYNYRNQDTRGLPLLLATSDETIRQSRQSRLGCALEFVDDLAKDFDVFVSPNPMRIETKRFLTGDGSVMERAINTLLDSRVEYPTDGLIFTPRMSPVAPGNDRRGNTWLSVYKWKPPQQNSIDFLVRFDTTTSTYDPTQNKQVFRGQLYVSRTPESEIVHPCETMTGEYVPPPIPYDMTRQGIATPSLFQPELPRNESASEILLPLNARGFPEDSEGERIEDNTIIECTRDGDRWVVMRTRNDKTYRYRALRRAEFGNSVSTAQNVWTNIHNPISEHMIRHVHSEPMEDTFEDTLYYRDSLASKDRSTSMGDIIKFHNEIKEQLYEENTMIGDTLLELAVGRGNDLHKWRKRKLSKVVGIDLFASNLNAPGQGACVRYLKAKQDQRADPMPPVLFIPADMTQPLTEQDHRYLRILRGEESAPTPYLENFSGLTEFTDVACQFAIHYACENEETFRRFAGNLSRHCKRVFFGTCMDGQEVYSMLMGTQGYAFRSKGQAWGQIDKEYADGEGWTEEFGRAIKVKLESFERPVTEYLVPFEKITSILKEFGFTLTSSELFKELYTKQSKVVLKDDHLKFSSVHRTFVFMRDEKAAEERAEEKKEEEKEKVEEEEKKEEEKKEEEEEEKKPGQKQLKKEAEKGEGPVLFTASGKGQAEFKALSTEHDAKIQINNISYPTVEHYVQWSKANLFGDAAAQTKILKTASAKSVKTYGNKIQGFKEDVWDSKKDQIMRTALRAKFTQHPDLRDLLLSTGDRVIGEADPRDKYWSIGTGPETVKAKKPSQWPGKNMLGTMMMELRAELKG